MRKYIAILMFSMLSFLPACAQLGVPTADTFNQKLAVAIGSVTAVRETATTLLKAQKITADDAQNVQDGANNARTGIEVARTLSKANMTAADNKLTAVSTALQALNAYLAARR